MRRQTACIGFFIGLDFSPIEAENSIVIFGRRTDQRPILTSTFISWLAGTDNVDRISWPPLMTKKITQASPVAEQLRALFHNHLIICPLCLVWVRDPQWPHVRQAKFCLRVCQAVFLGVLPFSPHLLFGAFHMSWNNLERDVKLNFNKYTRHQIKQYSVHVHIYVYRCKTTVSFAIS